MSLEFRKMDAGRAYTYGESRRPSLRRLAAWFAASVTNRHTAPVFVMLFAAIHALLWTTVLVNLDAAQDLHMDVAEAFAWGQKFQLGYGKHPPLSGWIAGIWFNIFPAADWAAYLLAMTTVACGLVVSWFIARRVVDYRRAFFIVVMLAIYPVFNFKGSKFNPDLLQLVTLPLLALAYLNAFEKRSTASGFWLGIAGVLALMTKYWVLTMIGAIGVAALLHPDRREFLRSPAPWVAIGVTVVGLIPHLLWLKQVDFVPLTYAVDIYTNPGRALSAWRVLKYINHNCALLALPILLAAAVLAGGHRFRAPSAVMARLWQRGTNPSVNLPQAINIWIIQVVLAVGPPLGGLAFAVYMKTDWGLSLFFLVPLALIAIPALRMPKIAVSRMTMLWLAITVLTLAASPAIALYDFVNNPNGALTYSARSQLAQELTQAWRSRFHSRWYVVAGTTEIGEPMTFYSPDHPAPLTPNEIWSSGLTSIEAAERYGFIGICDTTDNRLSECEAWMAKNAKNAEKLTIDTRRFFKGRPGPKTTWKIYIEPPSR